MANKDKGIPEKLTDGIKNIGEKIVEIKDPNQTAKDLRTVGDKVSDATTAFVGSWAFIFLFFIFFFIWIAANIYGWINHWDPYPFILLNLTLSALSAIQAPIILMSQNRQADKDRIRAEIDYHVNLKSEREVKELKKDLEEIKELVKNKT